MMISFVYCKDVTEWKKSVGEKVTICPPSPPPLQKNRLRLVVTTHWALTIGNVSAGVPPRASHHKCVHVGRYLDSLKVR